ncbi:hypothetical protein [Azospirillum sp. B506]|uniref:hypothetical protein n=1 Tax=Azospirillum sp. B506 TaxID=137721 RepID=UPI00131F2418|nr:hypothetical protein [Azospirillum sp. B506]
MAVGNGSVFDRPTSACPEPPGAILSNGETTKKRCRIATAVQRRPRPLRKNGLTEYIRIRNYFDIRGSTGGASLMEEQIMPTLWTALRSRWLDSGASSGPGRLCDHLRRDIGLTDGEAGDGEEPPLDCRLPPFHIRNRNLSEARTFLTLQPYR